ncbi:uncharacterized protein N7483_006679 [Penicillium malachiteum]|uniref:uncharacterized protein n=1 Tax=Penicillium malachiteum TaxID=1324776 RepID=UPI002548B8FC|nr:uncharacterized protein N7483_006679 [Penicillium malachiteum]KAJ5725322.1 hypothetical protein N7483_006679 [Penicillium malachiteum]
MPVNPVPRADLKNLKLPSNPQTWRAEIDQLGLSKETVHGRSLASASQMGYDQFLLLRVLWNVRKGKNSSAVDSLSSLLSLGDELKQAKIRLNGYKSWIQYFRTFEDSTISESTFALAHHYRLEVTKTKEDDAAVHFFTPIAQRTRSQASKSLL